MKKLLLILFLCIGTLQSHAVLKEKDLPQTLQILRTELTDYYRELSERMEMDKMQRDQVRTKLISIMRRANQSSLMLMPAMRRQNYITSSTDSNYPSRPSWTRPRAKLRVTTP